MNTHRFSVLVSCAPEGVLSENKDDFYEDYGFIALPENYSEDGKPTRLVISCHGAGGTVTTDDSQTEHQAITQYLLANGYAVMDTGGLPPRYAETFGIDIRNNVGSPIAMRCYEAAYRYCMERFNLYRNVFVHGASMGGTSSTNIVLKGAIPVIAHTAFCPAIDTYNQIFAKPWSGGLPKIALGKFYNFEKDENGEYIYDEEKVSGHNPATNEKVKNYPVPVKFWHCEDDMTVSYEVTKDFIENIKRHGGKASLETFPSGGHQPQFYGERVKNPAGIDVFGGNEIDVTPAVEGVFQWIKKYDSEERD